MKGIITDNSVGTNVPTKDRPTNEKPEKFLQVWFMPWAGLNREFQVGPVTFWPFSTTVKEKIPDKSVREHLEHYFRCYIDHQGNPASTVTVCSHGSVNFRKLKLGKANNVRAATDALIFSVICPSTKSAVCANNSSMGPPGADRCQLLAQNFRPGDDHIAIRAGKVLSGGWKIGQVTFPKPWCVGGAFRSPNHELVQGFSKVFEKSFPSDVRERLFRSLEWFRFAHTELDEVSPLSKVVMMATAFEVLLQVPNVRNKKEWIAKELEKRCANLKSIKTTRKDLKGRKYTYSKIAWWAWDFYNLRNTIVHGDVVSSKLLQYQAPGKKWLTHLIVADLVFWECIARELYAYGCIGDNVRAAIPIWQKLFPKDPPEALESLLLPSLLSFNDIHHALGWLPKLRKKP